MANERRSFLKGVVGIAGALATAEAGKAVLGSAGLAATSVGDRITVRDKLWLWAHTPGAHDRDYGLPGTSRMTPAEGAFYLNIPNLIMAGYPDRNAPCKLLPAPPYDQLALSFRPLKQVVWSVIGGGGLVRYEDFEFVRQLAKKFPNIVGVQLDDFFQTTLDGGLKGVLTPKELAYLRVQLVADGRRLETWTTVYRHDLKHDVSEYLNQIDVLEYWTWNAKDLVGLEEGFKQAERAAPRARKVLGCYMWDYGDSKPIPILLMEKQCKTGLQWLREGRIDGMIFLASCICDMEIEAVEWTRNWIREVGDQILQR
jgi:hypothetical protein